MKNLKILREKNNLTQQQMADLFGIQRPTYTRYEKGERQPDFDLLIKIASYFGVTTDYLLGKEDEPTPKKDSLDDVQFAFYGDVSDFTEEERRDLANFVEFIRAKRKGKSKE